MFLIKRVPIGDDLASAPSFQWRGSWLRSSPASWVGPRFRSGIGCREGRDDEKALLRFAELRSGRRPRRPVAPVRSSGAWFDPYWSGLRMPWL